MRLGQAPALGLDLLAIARKGRAQQIVHDPPESLARRVTIKSLSPLIPESDPPIRVADYDLCQAERACQLLLRSPRVWGLSERLYREGIMAKGSSGGARGGLARPVTPSSDLAAITGSNPLPRSEVVSDGIPVAQLIESASTSTSARARSA